MFKVSYSGTAIKDLEQIGDYIAEQLQNPQAALNTLHNIQDTIDKLSAFPHMGSLLADVTKTATDYRFLVCGNYLAFYHFSKDEVLIDRILYGQRDYIKILFKDLPQNNSK
ncbi:hypothetical protein FACS1894111_11830 [Clostridia bacterium]|nr:hypothetical protein FACS1894111_11830 [Clostridia bacterium]